MYIYRAVDSTDQTLDFLLNETRGTRAAKRFFRKVLGKPHITAPRVINVDKNPTYIGAVRDLKKEKLLLDKCKRRPSQYMNNIIEQDHRLIKRKIKPGLGFFSCSTTWCRICCPLARPSVQMFASVPPDLPTAYSDQDKIRQILLNTLSCDGHPGENCYLTMIRVLINLYYVSMLWPNCS